MRLAEPFTVKDAFQLSRPELYAKGYDTVLVELGSLEEEHEPPRYYSNNVWHFDTKAINTDGDYKAIAERMVQMSQGSLELKHSGPRRPR